MTKTTFAAVLATLLSLASESVFAAGAVRIECWGRCDLVTLGQACDAYAPNSVPIGLSCVQPSAAGSGSSAVCGGGPTCRTYGSLSRNDLLSSYCDDVGGFDAIVSCGSSAVPLAVPETPSSPKIDDK